MVWSPDPAPSRAPDSATPGVHLIGGPDAGGAQASTPRGCRRRLYPRLPGAPTVAQDDLVVPRGRRQFPLVARLGGRRADTGGPDPRRRSLVGRGAHRRTPASHGGQPGAQPQGPQSPRVNWSSTGREASDLVVAGPVHATETCPISRRRPVQRVHHSDPRSTTTIERPEIASARQDHQRISTSPAMPRTSSLAPPGAWSRRPSGPSSYRGARPRNSTT